MPWYICNSCCCGCSLRKGSVAIGLSFGFLNLLMLVSFIATAEHGIKEDGKITGTTAAMILLAVLYAIFVLANLLMIIGATQERPLLLMFWMIATGINLMVYMGMYAYAIYAIISASNGGQAYLMMIVPYMIGMTLLYTYCILLVNSYYLSLTQPPPVADPPYLQYVGNTERRWR